MVTKYVIIKIIYKVTTYFNNTLNRNMYYVMERYNGFN